MKKPHAFYRHYFRADLNQRRHLAWLWDTTMMPFDRKRFRLRFRFKLISFWVLLPLLVCQELVGPYLDRFDLFVDNSVGGLKRITQGLLGLVSFSLMGALMIGMVGVHLLNWSFLEKLGIYLCACIIFVPLANVGCRCMERCVCNFCADMKDWGD